MYGHEQSRFAKGSDFRTEQSILNSAYYNPIPIDGTGTLLHAAYPIPPDFLRERLTAQEREEIYKHVKTIIKSEDGKPGFLEAVNITKADLEAIRIEDSEDATSTTTAIDSTRRLVEWNDWVEFGSVPPSNSSPRSVAASFHTAQEDITPIPSLVRQPRRPANFGNSSVTGMATTPSPAATRINETSSELLKLDERLFQLDTLIDDYASKKPDLFVHAREASRAARQAIVRARSITANTRNSLLEARAKTTAAEQVVEDAITKAVLRDSLSSRSSMNQRDTQSQRPRSRSRTRLEEGMDELVNFTREFRIGQDQSQRNHRSQQPSPGTLTNDDRGRSSSSEVEEIRSRREAEADRNSHQRPSSPLPPYSPSQTPSHALTHPAERPNSTMSHSFHNGNYQAVTYNHIYIQQHFYQPDIHALGPTTTHHSPLHYANKSIRKVCRCSNPYKHRVITWVQYPPVRDRCVEFFRRNPDMLMCADHQWFSIDIGDGYGAPWRVNQ